MRTQGEHEPSPASRAINGLARGSLRALGRDRLHLDRCSRAGRAEVVQLLKHVRQVQVVWTCRATPAPSGSLHSCGSWNAQFS